MYMCVSVSRSLCGIHLNPRPHSAQTPDSSSICSISQYPPSNGQSMPATLLDYTLHSHPDLTRAIPPNRYAKQNINCKQTEIFQQAQKEWNRSPLHLRAALCGTGTGRNGLCESPIYEEGRRRLVSRFPSLLFRFLALQRGRTTRRCLHVHDIVSNPIIHLAVIGDQTHGGGYGLDCTRTRCRVGGLPRYLHGRTSCSGETTWVMADQYTIARM